MESQQLTPEEIVDEVDEPRDAPPSATVVRFQWLRWLLEKTPGIFEDNPKVHELKVAIHNRQAQQRNEESVASTTEEV